MPASQAVAGWISWVGREVLKLTREQGALSSSYAFVHLFTSLLVLPSISITCLASGQGQCVENFMPVCGPVFCPSFVSCQLLAHHRWWLIQELPLEWIQPSPSFFSSISLLPAVGWVVRIPDWHKEGDRGRFPVCDSDSWPHPSLLHRVILFINITDIDVGVAYRDNLLQLSLDTWKIMILF